MFCTFMSRNVAPINDQRISYLVEEYRSTTVLTTATASEGKPNDATTTTYQAVITPRFGSMDLTTTRINDEAQQNFIISGATCTATIICIYTSTTVMWRTGEQTQA